MKKIKYMKRLVLYFTEHSLFQNLCRLSLFSVWFWLHLVPTVQSKVCSSQTVLRIWIQPDLYLFVGSGPYEGFDQNVRIRIPVQIQPKYYWLFLTFLTLLYDQCCGSTVEPNPVRSRFFVRSGPQSRIRIRTIILQIRKTVISNNWI